MPAGRGATGRRAAGGDRSLIAALRARIAAIESSGLGGEGSGLGGKGSGLGGEAGALSLGAAEIDAALPWGGLRLGALHEVVAADAGAAAGFVATILARLARLGTGDGTGEGTGEGTGGGTVLWCLPARAAAEAGGLYGPGLAAFGLEPERLIVVRGRNDREVLWAMEEGLRSGRLAAVLAEVSKLGLGPSRRLQLAAEAGATTALMLRPREAAEPSAALTRWRLDAAPSAGLHGFGCHPHRAGRLIPSELVTDSSHRPSRRPFGPPQGEDLSFTYNPLPHAEEPAKPASRSTEQRSQPCSAGIISLNTLHNSPLPWREGARGRGREPTHTSVQSGTGEGAGGGPSPGLGRARWRLDLLRCRGGVPRTWFVEWRDETGDLGVVPHLPHRPAEPAAGAGEGRRRAG